MKLAIDFLSTRCQLPSVFKHLKSFRQVEVSSSTQIWPFKRKFKRKLPTLEIELTTPTINGLKDRWQIS